MFIELIVIEMSAL